VAVGRAAVGDRRARLGLDLSCPATAPARDRRDPGSAWLTAEQQAARCIIGLWRPSEASLADRIFRPWRFLPRFFAYAWVAVLAIRLFVLR